MDHFSNQTACTITKHVSMTRIIRILSEANRVGSKLLKKTQQTKIKQTKIKQTNHLPYIVKNNNPKTKGYEERNNMP